MMPRMDFDEVFVSDREHPKVAVHATLADGAGSMIFLGTVYRLPKGYRPIQADGDRVLDDTRTFDEAVGRIVAGYGIWLDDGIAAGPDWEDFGRRWREAERDHAAGA